MSTTATQLDVLRQAVPSSTQSQGFAIGQGSNRLSNTGRYGTHLCHENTPSMSAAKSNASLQGSQSIPPQVPAGGSSRNQGQGTDPGDGDDDEETQRPPLSQTSSESQEPASTSATSTSENVWDYSVPVPGSKKGNVIYPKATVELSPWTRDQWLSRFLFVKSELESLVYRHLRLLSMESCPVYTARMVGTCPENARPSVVVTCRDVDSKNIRNLFRSRAESQLSLRQESDSSSHSSTMSHLRSTLRFRKEPAKDSPTIPPLQLVYYRTRTPTVIRNALDAPLLAFLDSNGATCGAMVESNGTRATLGVCLDLGLLSWSTVFMTVDHLFSGAIPEPESATHSTEVPFLDTSRDTSDSMSMDLDLDSPNSLWDDDDEYDDDWEMEDPMHLDHDMMTEVTHTPAKQIEGVLPSFQEVRPLSQQKDGMLWGRIVPPKQLSFRSPYLDWALVRPSPLQPSPLRYSLINTIFPDGPERPAVVLDELERSPPSHLAPVYIVSGVRGIIRGQIITAPSYLPSLRPEQGSCEAWTVILDGQNSILPGECGSVVVNRATNRIYGHVVGNDALGHAYIVPMVHVFDQINTCFDGIASPVRLKAPGRVEDTAAVPSAAEQHAFVHTFAVSDPLNVSEFESYEESGSEDLFLNGEGDMVSLSQIVFESLGRQGLLSSSRPEQTLGSVCSMTSDEESFQMAATTVGTSVPPEPHSPTQEPLDFSVPLYGLRIEEWHREKGIRLLIRPNSITHSLNPNTVGSSSCEWITLQAKGTYGSLPEEKVLAVTQTAQDIKFSMKLPIAELIDPAQEPLNCELYYDPASDKQIFLNRSIVPIRLQRLSADPNADNLASRHDINDLDVVVNPGMAKGLAPATWTLSAFDVEVLEFRIIEKHVHAAVISPDNPPHHGKEGKQTVQVTKDEQELLRIDETPDAHPLLEAKHDDGFLIPQYAKTGDFTVPHAIKDGPEQNSLATQYHEYKLTQRDPISSKPLSSVYTAEHSSHPDEVITVKVLKTKTLSTRNTGTTASKRPDESHMNVIRQADLWLREYQSQEPLLHDSLVRLYGGDARFLSLYMEHVDAPDISAKGKWREAETGMFMGTRADAARVLRDIGSALQYLHSRGSVHNDVKPANILYSRDRGGVLCDFGLSTSGDKAMTGGTPYYLPPEYARAKVRGPPSDIWALGITMLYLLGCVPLPDLRVRKDHPQQLYWLIADLHRHRRKHEETGNEAMQKMMSWVGEISDVVATLGSDALESIVVEMLREDPARRITADSLMAKLDGLRELVEKPVSRTEGVTHHTDAGP
ncbi:Calcium/calmodulin-dependent protein kinase type 1 [Paramyrothecium foliicola]|nr:Calcium/calmodulin-dependent protein kinase type 1 [Paramyrothecium foliicola]